MIREILGIGWTPKLRRAEPLGLAVAHHTVLVMRPGGRTSARRLARGREVLCGIEAPARLIAFGLPRAGDFFGASPKRVMSAAPPGGIRCPVTDHTRLLIFAISAATVLGVIVVVLWRM